MNKIKTGVEVFRTHRWVIKEIGGFGPSDPKDAQSLLYACSVKLPELTPTGCGTSTIRWYVTDLSVDFIHKIAQIIRGKNVDIKVDAVDGNSNTIGTWQMSECDLVSFNVDELDYTSSELLMATLVVKPQNLDYS